MSGLMLLKVRVVILLAFFWGNIATVNAVDDSGSSVGEYQLKVQKTFDRGMKRHKVMVEKGGLFPRKSNRYVRYGRNSFLVEIPSISAGVKSSEYIKNRSEIEIVRPVRLQGEHWVQFSVFFPKNFKQPDNWFIFFQAWQKNAGNPILTLRLDALGRIQVDVRNDEFNKGQPLVLYKDHKEVVRGAWNDFVLRLNITGQLNKDSLSVWRRVGGEQKCFKALVNYRGLTIGKSFYRNGYPIKKNDRYVSFRAGIYRGRSNLAHQIWFDGLKYGKKMVVKNLYININCIN